MNREEERDHLRWGAAGAGPPAQVDILEFETSDPERTLGRVREVMEVVLDHSGGSWPEVDEWLRLLPAWFLDRCVDDRELRDCVLDQWSVRGWTYWLQPEARKWRWWDAHVEGNGVRLEVLALQEGYLHGALDWLFTIAGE